MKTLRVINLVSKHKAFRRNDGLFAVKQLRGDVYHLWKIKDGKLLCYDDGTPHIICVSVTSAEIQSTNMRITVH